MLGERLCIKYKIMAVQPLNKTKIIKKKTNKIRRFQSDEFKRVKVRNPPAFARPLLKSGPRRVPGRGAGLVEQD